MGKLIKLICLFALLGSLCVLGGCAKAPGETTAEDTYILYYTDAQRFSLVEERHTVTGATVQEMAFTMLSKMQTPEQVGNHSLFNVEGLVKRVNLDGENLLGVYMTEGYSKLSVSDEVLLRAGIVKALIQLKGIEYVSIYVNEQPLTDSLGNAVGIMSAQSFLDARGENLSNYQQVTLNVYYGDPGSGLLVGEERESTISSSFSMERQVIHALLEGPEDSSLLPTMPAGTGLLSVSVKNKICYVNLSRNFLTGELQTNPYVTIYSLVNSLTELTNISKVQIMVEGDSSVKFKEIIPLNAPFERNLDYNVTGGKTK